ncbi:MAG TPA: SPASM domain-containing protein [Bdellovibrionales bacterium]|nr:SPASM domain-containing protein [Bdellovibrionales bacterium]
METKAPNLESLGLSEDNFCYYPFTQLLFQPTGVISPCCWNQDIVLGVVPNETLEDIWNGEKARGLRREFLSGNPVSCKTQMQHIRCHAWSRRNYEREMSFTELQPRGPQRLDVRLNGKCNLQCVMCEVWKQPNGLYDQSDFWTRGPAEIFPFLREVDVLGGEPFVQQDTYRLIDEVSQINPECTWAFVTNGHYKFNAAIQSRLDKIKIRWIQVSLDSVVPETYAKVRVNGELSKTLKTVDDFIAYLGARPADRKFHFNVSMCVHRLNWHELDKSLAYARGKGVPVILQFAFQPESVSLLSLSQSDRREILRFARSLEREYGADVLHPIVSPLQDSLEREPSPRAEAVP